MSDQQQRPSPPARYEGRQRPPSRRAAWAFGIVFGLLVAGFTYRVANRFLGPVSATLSSYDVRDDDTLRITFEMRRDPQRDAVCLLRARGRQGVDLGHAEVRIGADAKGPNKLTLTYDLTTTARAATGEVARCTDLAPGEPLPNVEATPHPGIASPVPAG